MLTREGSAPGSGWMRNVSDRLSSGPADSRSTFPRNYWIFYGIFMIVILGIVPMLQRRTMPVYSTRVYESSAQVAGLPLFAFGPSPVAIIAVGGRPRGVIAIGGIATGIIAVGGLAVGGLAVGGLALGWRALGGCAIGYRAFGGVALGAYAYAGNGAAYGYHEASGRQREKLVG
jgi:hypothetical protein